MYTKATINQLKEAVADWSERNEAKFKTERKEFITDSGVPIKRVYTPLDLEERGFDYMKHSGLPGEYPYARGNTPVGYRAKLWTATAYGGKGALEESNALWKAQVAAGAQAIFVAYDLPTQLGYDPGHVKATGEVGRVGISMISQKDWEIAWDGIDFKNVGVYQVFNAPAIFGLANHIALAKSRGISESEVQGLQQNDVLKEYMARGNFIFPPGPSIRLTSDVLQYVGNNLPRYQAVTVCGVHQTERGATKIHELALMMIDGATYLQAAVDRGIDVDRLAPGIMFFPGSDHFAFFEEVAKFRAMRRMWASIVRDRFKAKKPESMQCRIYSAQGGLGLFREQYLNNIGRTALATLAASLGGVETLDTRSYDEQYGIPTTEAQVTSIRIQNVVAYETGVDSVVDPLGGSYYIESLTSEMEERAWKVITEIEKQGGMIRALETGYVQRMIAKDAYEWQKRLESGDINRVGFNLFKSSEGSEAEKPVRVYRADPAVEQLRADAVAEMKRKRDNRKVLRSLDELTALARQPESATNNMMPAMLEAVKEYATVGEVCDALRTAWGEFREPAVF